MEGWEQRLWMSLGGLLLVPLAGLAMLGAQQPWGWAALAAGAVVGTSIARRLTRVRKGRLGEKLITNLLQRLSDDYYLVNDVTFDGARGNIDHVVIGPCGVVVIETKRLAGTIRCHGSSWYTNGRRTKSISTQVNTGAARVREFLTRLHPDFQSSVLRWVESVVVFTHPTCRLEVDRPRTTVVRYSELVSLILELARRHRLDPAIAARLAQSLALSQGPGAGREQLPATGQRRPEPVKQR